jgi:diguanylate cyclase (GGDEF)-like protein
MNMASWFRRLLPLVTWAAFLLGYQQVSDAAGDYAPLVGLGLVALSGWMWGAIGGLSAGIVGYFSVQVRAYGLGISAWQPLDLFAVDQSFAFVAYAGTGLVIGWFRKLERNLRHERAVSQRAMVDPLTGALVRSAFEERLRKELEQAAEGNGGLALLFVDLDRFKFVNDTYGHDIGDKLLTAVGKVLRDNVRTNDLVGRVGGDEFMVALPGVRDEDSAAEIARSLVRELSAPFTVEGRELQVSASIGVSLYPRDGTNAESLLHSADSAMYQVKQGGKNSFHFSTVEVRTRLSRRLELERKLRNALPENQLEVVYQPQVRLSDGGLVGFEALLRWRSPELGMVSPAEFVPVAEDAGLIASIGHWMLRESAMQQRAWQRLGYAPVRMAVNVSTLQFHQPSFFDTVKGALADSGVDPGLFEIEVTESVLVRDQELAVKTLRLLRRLGVRIALDDFGTGYSSLAYLQRLPIRTLKIDQSFVQGLVPHPLRASGHAGRATGSGLDADAVVFNSSSRLGVRPSAVFGNAPGAGPIVEAIAAMAHKLGKEIVAEGVESAFQRNFLRRLGVDLAQGYFFSRPMQPAQAEQLLRRVTMELKSARVDKERQERSNEEAASGVWHSLGGVREIPASRGLPEVAGAAMATSHVPVAYESADAEPDVKFNDLLLWE